MRNTLIYLALVFALIGCTAPQAPQELPQFSALTASQTGIEFTNTLTLTDDFDVFRYRNYYNGGGVAIGDINNDGLSDIYLTANMQPNKLFINQGDFKFEDISATAGVAGQKIWSTGVSMADVNGDGLLDIYVCNSGDIKGGQRENELFINNGDLTFTERAAEYGLADLGFSTHAVFFDYDQDGDMDCYILNNSFRPVSTLGLENIRHERDSTGGDKLYRNTQNKFEDVSDTAGIYGSVIGFGLGVTITDVNLDSWMDIYVSNDFFERDYLYINQADGTFKDELTTRIGHISQFSMGADAADINNDGRPEIFVTDMLPDNDRRLKTVTNFESYDIYQNKLENDYYEQYMRNTLQLNGPDGSFQEIGQYAGVEATDWSWGAVIADFDLDSNKEIFVSNGVYRDVTDQDFINFLANEENVIAAMKQEKVDFQNLVERMPSNKLSNFLFKSSETLQFKNVSDDWGLAEPSFSNGAAYGDLDNDGDLDLVVNNVNQELFVYRNESYQKGSGHFLKLSFSGPDQNLFGVGARVNAYFDGQNVMVENIPTKGFQSSMDYTMVLGLGNATHIDSLVVHWGYGKSQVLKDISVDQELQLDIADATPVKQATTHHITPLFKSHQAILNPPYRHRENRFVDFDYERLTYRMLSHEGPALAIGDLNKDDLDDFFVGGASGSPGHLYLQQQDGSFKAINQMIFTPHDSYEDVDAAFFDADGDADLDLYVVSGGNSYAEGSQQYQDRLYLQTGVVNGVPQYTYAPQNVPRTAAVGACVRPADFDADGDIDLFVGSRNVALQYGLPASSFLYVNDGTGNFEDQTAKISPKMNRLGMITDATWVDFDDDDDLDLVVVGEWSPIMLFKNNGQNLERLNNVPGLEKSNGWWTSVIAADLNDDDNIDFVVGNWGLNSKFKATADEPITLYIGDFDENQTIDHVFGYYEDGKLLPMALKHDLTMQLNYLKKDYLSYKDYANKSLEEIFGADPLNNALIQKAYNLQSVSIINVGDGSYEMQPLPMETQYAPVLSLTAADYDKDSRTELLVLGNFYGTKPEEGRYDANKGILLEVDQGIAGSLSNPLQTGLQISGEVRGTATLRTTDNQRLLLVAKNNDQLEFYVY